MIDIHLTYDSLAIIRYNFGKYTRAEVCQAWQILARRNFAQWQADVDWSYLLELPETLAAARAERYETYAWQMRHMPLVLELKKEFRAILREMWLQQLAKRMDREV